MARYLINWSMDLSRMPEDPELRGKHVMSLLELVSHDLETGDLKDWGVIPGQAQGFCITECEPAALVPLLMKYLPKMKFETHPLLNFEESSAAIIKMRSQQ